MPNSHISTLVYLGRYARTASESSSRPAKRLNVPVKPTTVAFGTPDRVEWHLHNWQTWMHTGRSVDRLPRRSTGIGNSSSSSFEDMTDASDIRCAMITDAIISDLEPAQSSAIHRRYLSAVYRFPRDNYAEMLLKAKLEIGLKLSIRGVW